MNKRELDKLLNNPGPGLIDSAMTQRRLERAGVTISKDLMDEGFVPYEKRKFPKYINDFVDYQMSLIDRTHTLR